MKTKTIIKNLRENAQMWFNGVCPSNGILPAMAADRLEMLSVELKRLQCNRENLKEELIWAINCLHDSGGCTGCKHDKPELAEPCTGCMRFAGTTEDKWEWRFAKDTNVPSKTATDTNVGHKEEE